MPWKIKNTTNLNHPTNPVIHLWDRTVNVNMVQHLESGTVDLWVGADSPQEASIYLTIDVERLPIVQLEATTHPPKRIDLNVMQTVLESLGHSPAILQPLYRGNRRRDFPYDYEDEDAGEAGRKWAR